MGGLTLHDDEPNYMPRRKINDDEGDLMKQKLLKLQRMEEARIAANQKIYEMS